MIRWMVGLCVVLIASGCSLEPRYRTSDLVFDPGLVGVWAFRGEPEEGKEPPPVVRVEFVPRQFEVVDGRVNPDKPVSPIENANAYLLTVSEPGAEGGPAKKQELGGFVLGIGEVRVLGVQHVGGEGGSGLFVRPLHQVLRLSRDGDTMRLRGSKYDIAWIPASQPLDAPTDEQPGKSVPTIEELERRKDGGKFIVFSIDRLVEVLRVHAEKGEFWQDGEIVGRREGGVTPGKAP